MRGGRLKEIILDIIEQSEFNKSNYDEGVVWKEGYLADKEACIALAIKRINEELES